MLTEITRAFSSELLTKKAAFTMFICGGGVGTSRETLAFLET